MSLFVVMLFPLFYVPACSLVVMTIHYMINWSTPVCILVHYFVDIMPLVSLVHWLVLSVFFQNGMDLFSSAEQKWRYSSDEYGYQSVDGTLFFFPILWKSKGYIFFYPYLILCSAEEYICNEVILILGWAIHLTNNTNIYWSSSNHSQCRK